MKVYAQPASQASGVDHEAENRRLKRELARMTEERDIFKLAGLEIDPGDQYPGVTRPGNGQCGCRELLQFAQARTNSPPGIQNTRGRKAGHLRLHRNVL